MITSLLAGVSSASRIENRREAVSESGDLGSASVAVKSQAKRPPDGWQQPAG